LKEAKVRDQKGLEKKVEDLTKEKSYWASKAAEIEEEMEEKLQRLKKNHEGEFEKMKEDFEV